MTERLKSIIRPAELAELEIWLRECCDMDIHQMQEHEILRAFGSWQDELFRQANPELFPDWD